MAHYGTLRDFVFDNNIDVDDIRGSAVYGVDNEKLGKIDDVIFDHSSGELRYAVVDTGGWLSSKKFLVPADRIHDYEKDKDAFQVDLTKEHVERFPRYDEDRMKSESDWKDYEDRYKKGWDEAPVQHQEGRIDLNITPADVSGIRPTEVRAQRDLNVPLGSMGEEIGDVRETNIHRMERTDRERLDRDRLDVHRADVGQWHPRMKRFEDVLRKNRVDVTASCASCAAAKEDEAA